MSSTGENRLQRRRQRHIQLRTAASAFKEGVGVYGSGTFTIGGTNTLGPGGDVMIGYGATGRGTYNLQGGGISDDISYSGYDGTGIIIQSGGHQHRQSAAFPRLYGEGSGTYNLQRRQSGSRY